RIRSNGIATAYPVPLKRDAGNCVAALDWTYSAAYPWVDEGMQSNKKYLDAAFDRYLAAPLEDSVRQKYVAAKQYYSHRVDELKGVARQDGTDVGQAHS